MRVVQVGVPEANLDAIAPVQQDGELGYTVTDGAVDSAEEFVVSFVAPADTVERVLDDLLGSSYDRGTVTVRVGADLASVRAVEEVRDRWATTPSRRSPATAPGRRRAKAVAFWLYAANPWDDPLSPRAHAWV